MAKASKKEQPKIEPGPAADVLEELFNDFNRDRKQIYKLNLFRGIFFGAGSALGGTLVIALMVWMLSLFSNTWLRPLVEAVQQAAH